MTSSATSWLRFMDEGVVVDTGVWSLLFARAGANDLPHVTTWRETLRGKIVTVATQTQAELLFGALVSAWGPQRLTRLRQRLAEFPVLPVSQSVVEAHARLRAECRRRGHPLEQPVHQGDAWIAATAVAYDLPLATMDQIFDGAPNLRLIEADL